MHRRALALKELLIVLFILALVAGAVAPALLRTKGVYQSSKCKNSLGQMALAVQAADALVGAVPAGGAYLAGDGGIGSAGSVHFHLLPFLEADNTYRAIAASIPASSRPGTCTCDWCGAGNPGGCTADVADVNVYPDSKLYHLYVCGWVDPQQSVVTVGPQRYGVTDYAANLQLFGNFRYKSPRVSLAAACPDGTAYTVSFAERFGECVSVGGCRGALQAGYASWLGVGVGVNDPVFARRGADGITPDIRLPQIKPANGECDPWGTQSHHETGTPTAMADGSVKWVSPTITLATWRAMVLPADGQTPKGQWALPARERQWYEPLIRE